MTRNVVILLCLVSLSIWGCGPTEQAETVSESPEKAVEPIEVAEDIVIQQPDSADVSMRDACIANQRECEGAVAIYTKMNEGNPPENLEDVVGDYLEEIPVCPKGGGYILDPETGSVTCSLEEHQRVEE